MSGTQSEPRRSRPQMPNYGIASGDEGLMTWDWVDAQMAKSRNYWICSTCADGRPHAAPVWGVWLDGALYFGTDRTSRKAANLARSPEVVVHLESGDETVIFEGVVEEVRDRALLARIAAANKAKYPPYDPDPEPAPGVVMYTLKPRLAFAWLEKDFPNTATRWQFE